MERFTGNIFNIGISVTGTGSQVSITWSGIMGFGIKGYIPTSLVDWPGNISSVLFLPDCCFRCPFCHNHKLVKDSESLPDYPVSEIMGNLERRKNWIDGVTITGGEPTVHKALTELLKHLKSRGFRVKLDTNGSNPAMLAEIIRKGLVDAVFMDIKAPLTSEEYSRAAGVPVKVKTIKSSIALLKDSGLEICFRTTVVPGLVQEPQLAAIRKSLGDVPTYLIQPFRNIETLDPKFAALKEFGLGRFEKMQADFQILPEGEERALADAG